MARLAYMVAAAAAVAGVAAAGGGMRGKKHGGSGAARTVSGRTLHGVGSRAIYDTLAAGKYTGARMQALAADNSTVEPQQLKLALTGDPTSMNLVFITFQECTGSVQYWPASGATGPVWVTTVETSYTAGMFGWDGFIHTGDMTGLTPGVAYTYSAGCTNATAALWSEPRNFTAAPVPGAQQVSYVAVTADMGTIVPLGFMVAEAITADHLESGHPFDMVVIAGDISYATIDPPNNEVEWTWDAFGIQNEPFTSTAPYMTTVGNHEDVPGTSINATGSFATNFTAFQARYHMPCERSGGNGNLWFSYDYKNVHYISVSSESDYSTGSPQWNWAAADLAAAAANRNVTPWIIFMLHRPVYSVDADEYTSHIPGAPLAVAWEPLFMEYGVDLVLTGHQHEGEYTHAVFNGTVLTWPTANNTYVNPGAPLYVVQGTSGAMQEETYVSPIPAWSAWHQQGVYGYGRMTVSGASQLYYEFVDTNGFQQFNFTLLRTSSAAAA